MTELQKQMNPQTTQQINNKLVDIINELITNRTNLENMINDEEISYEKINENQQIVEKNLKHLKSFINALTHRGFSFTFTEEDIQKYGYNPIEKANEEINKPIAQRMDSIFKLNYNYDVTFINLRDIRFSQQNISEPFNKEVEQNIATSMNNYPFKFYNYKNNNLILLGMFGEFDYKSNTKEDSSYPPTVPSLNVVHFADSNCYVSIDNRRIELIYRQLCLLLSVNPDSCTIDSMMFKNTNDFLRFELGIPEEVNIYIPCSVKSSTDKPPRKMKTPEGSQLKKLNKELGVPLDKVVPTYASVIWQRVSNPHIDKYRDYPLAGMQSFPTTLYPISTNEKVNKDDKIILYKNKYPCRKKSDVSNGPISIQNIVDNLLKNGTIKPLDHTLKYEVVYENLKKLYYNVANIFINHLLSGNDEFVEYVSYDDLYNTSLKFIPDFEKWKTEIDKIPLYPDKTGGKGRKYSKTIKCGTRKRCKKCYIKNAQIKKCVKKNNKTVKSKKGSHFRIGVKFGGVLAKHSKKIKKLHL